MQAQVPPLFASDTLPSPPSAERSDHLSIAQRWTPKQLREEIARCSRIDGGPPIQLWPLKRCPREFCELTLFDRQVDNNHALEFFRLANTPNSDTWCRVAQFWGGHEWFVWSRSRPRDAR